VTTTVLAIDDSKTMRKVMEITFAGEGFKTVVAADAGDALAKVQSERPQVALVDAGLEGTSGYDLCRQIKNASPSTVVVLLSNKAQPYDKARGAAAGADDFMDKPFDTQQMIDKVTMLAKRGAQAPAQAPAAAPPAVSPFAAPAAAKPADLRPRVQTLSYGASPVPIPSPPAASAPPAAPTPTQPAASGSSFGSRAPAAPPPPVYAAPVQPAYVQPAPVQPAPVQPAPVAAAATVSGGNGMPADFAAKLGGLGLTAAQVDGVLALSREVVEKVVWEVVPVLAETLIKEEISRLTRE